MLKRMEQKIEDIKNYMDEKFENQQSFSSGIAKGICSTVFESFEKIIKGQIDKQNDRISILEADKSLLMQNNKDDLEQ